MECTWGVDGTAHTPSALSVRKSQSPELAPPPARHKATPYALLEKAPGWNRFSGGLVSEARWAPGGAELREAEGAEHKEVGAG